MMDPKLYKAATKGDVSCLAEVHGTNRTVEEATDNQYGNFINSTQHGKNNILHISARAGRHIFVKEAFQHFPFLSDQENSQGDTPLSVAARFGHLEVVEKLMLQGTTVTSTALHLALRNGHENVAQHLLRSKPEMAIVDTNAGESPLYLAAESCCHRFMLQILLSGRPYSAHGPNRQNALHAAQNCYGAIIHLLIVENPELMKQLDNRGKAAIHYAVEADYWVSLDEMLKADARIALLPDNDGYTPLLRACSRGCWKVCQKILKICPESIEARGLKGQNALHLCKFRKYNDLKFLMIPEIQELLNVGDDDGNTPLHLAIKENDLEKAMTLLSWRNIDLGALNKDGRTALDICESDWKVLNRLQRETFFHLWRNKAPRGRQPTTHKVPNAPNEWKSLINTMSVVATLIATVTFAAAFTMPGGFHSDSSTDGGLAVLVKKAAFKVFILSDTLAMCCSITVVFLLMWAIFAREDIIWALTNISWISLNIALRATLVAFMSGIFAVIAPKVLWVAILVCVACSIASSAVDLNMIMSSTIFIWLSPTISINVLPMMQKLHQILNRNKDQHYVISEIESWRQKMKREREQRYEQSQIELYSLL